MSYKIILEDHVYSDSSYFHDMSTPKTPFFASRSAIWFCLLHHAACVCWCLYKAFGTSSSLKFEAISDRVQPQGGYHPVMFNSLWVQNFIPVKPSWKSCHWPWCSSAGKKTTYLFLYQKMLRVRRQLFICLIGAFCFGVVTVNVPLWALPWSSLCRFSFQPLTCQIVFATALLPLGEVHTVLCVRRSPYGIIPCSLKIRSAKDLTLSGCT